MPERFDSSFGSQAVAVHIGKPIWTVRLNQVFSEYLSNGALNLLWKLFTRILIRPLFVQTPPPLSRERILFDHG